MDDLVIAVATSKSLEAYRTLFDHFAPRVKPFLLGNGTGPEVAEEAVQEAMLNVWRKAGHFDPTKAVASTQIFAIARNTRIDLLRKGNCPALDPNDPALVPAPTAPAFATVSAAQEANRIRLAVRRIRNEIGESECVSIIIQERIAAYTSSLEDPVASSTVFTYILDLLAHVRRIAPERDQSWLADIKNRLCARAHPAKDKTPQIRSSQDLFELGIALMESADDASCRYKRLGCEIQFRDQLLIAFLTSRPIRLKNLAALKLGRHIVQVDGIFWLRLHSDVTRKPQTYRGYINERLDALSRDLLKPPFPQ